MTRLEIFVSSKMQELKAERDMLYELIPTLGNEILDLHAWVFEEDAPSTEKTIREVYLDALKNSQLYIGLFGNEYGEWTIDEYHRATEWGIDRHIYVKDVDTEKRDPKLAAFLNEQQQVTFGTTHKWFKTVEELEEAVKRSIKIWLDEKTRRRPGSLSAILAKHPDDILERPRKLIGREALQEQILSALDYGDRVLLQGFGGMGKTALAATVAGDWIEVGKGSVLWQKAGSDSPQAFFTALARPFNLSKEMTSAEDEEQLQLVRQMLTQSGAKLFIIDDAWDGNALQTILKAIPRSIGVIVTSRFTYPLDEIIEIGALPPDKSVETLGFYARKDFVEDPAAMELCEFLGHHAYALEIAGSTIKTSRTTPAEMHERIKSAPQYMEMPFNFAEEGRESVASLIKVSLDWLDTQTRYIFMAFGAFFASSATPEMLALYMGTEQEKIQEGLIKLEEQGLASSTPATQENVKYYRIHDLAYNYARFYMLDKQRNKALDACLTYIQRYNEPTLPNFAALRPELDNLLNAADWAIAAERYDDVATFTNELYFGEGGWKFLSLQGFYTQSIYLLKNAANAAERSGSKQQQSSRLGNLGIAYAELGQYEKAIDYHLQSLAVAQEIGNKLGQGASLGNLGLTYYSLGQHKKAIDYHLQSLAIKQEIGDRRGEGNSLGSLGIAYKDLGQYEKAIDYHLQALVIAKEIGDKRNEGIHLGNLGNAYRNLAQHESAIEYYEKALIIAREIGDRRSEGNWLGNLGTAHKNLEQYEKAIDYHLQSLAIKQEIGDQRGQGNSLGNLGNTYTNLEQYEKAIDYHLQALVITKEIGNKFAEGVILGNLGVAYQNLEQYEKALDYYQQSLVIAQELGDRSGEAEELYHIGSLHEDQSHNELALEFYGQARAVYASLELGYRVEHVDQNIADVKRKMSGG